MQAHPRLARLTLVGVLVVVFTGCSASAPSPVPPVTSPPNANSADAVETAPPAPVPNSCTDIVFEEDATLSGAELGTCMGDAMEQAGSGSSRDESLIDGLVETQFVDFQWDPTYSMSVTGGEVGDLVITEDTGWMRMPGEDWIQADPNDPDKTLVTSVVKVVRKAADPRAYRAYMGLSPTWTVVEKQAVPSEGAFHAKAWLLTPDVPINLWGVTVNDYQMWIGDDFLGSYATGTGTAGGISVKSSQTFLQWGLPVNIPKPPGF